jgi:hypothetical protein
VLTSVYPLTRSIDLRVRLYGRDYSRCRYFYLSSAFNDLLECRTHIPLPLREQADGMRVSVYRRSVTKPVVLCDGCGATPVHEITLYLLALRMGANPALRGMSPLAGRGGVALKVWVLSS